MKIYHNPECSKSRESLYILEDISSVTNTDPEIVDYQQNPPSKGELKELLKMLGMSAFDLVRKNEPLYKEKFENSSFSEEQWLDILINNPILIERPIVVHNGKAVLGRPPENVRKLFV